MTLSVRSLIRSTVARARTSQLPAIVESTLRWPLARRSGTFRTQKELEIFLRHNWYHDFTPLGLRTNQFRTPIFYKLNQAAKQQRIFHLIDRAIASCQETGLSEISGLELFCADGFYSNYAVNRGVDRMVSIDADGDSVERRSGILAQARLITRLLGNGNQIEYRQADVFDVDGSYDLCVCAGGLYHLRNPRELLAKLQSHVKVALVIQTVVSLSEPDPDYFESPAPGLTWGCRFSRAHLESMLLSTGWKVLESSMNELTGNRRSSDRGSAYVLCVRDHDS